MDMQKMWNAYAQECRVLRERIAALRQALEDEKLMPMERHELDRRNVCSAKRHGIWNGVCGALPSMRRRKGRGCRMRMTARTAWEEMLFPEDLRVERWEKQRVACLIAKILWKTRSRRDKNRSSCYTIKRRKPCRRSHGSWVSVSLLFPGRTAVPVKRCAAGCGRMDFWDEVFFENWRITRS